MINNVESFQKTVAEALSKGASDIHISPMLPIYFRVHGKIYPLADSVLSYDIDRFLKSILSSSQIDYLQKRRQLDFIYQLPNKTRLRGNAFYCREGVAVCFRIINEKIRDFGSLGLPDFMKNKALSLKQGLVLIVGPTGQGKSTTLASLLMERNKNLTEHIVMIEDPIEFLIPSVSSIVQQREVGRDVLSFEDGITAALREDPNVIMIGEMRDKKTMSSALTVAETGHLVFATLHTTSAVHTISRILDSFSTDQQPQVRSQLAANLKMVISQRLVPSADGRGRVLSYEILNMNHAIGSLIRQDKIFQIPNMFKTDSSSESVQFEQSLAGLLMGGKVSQETAYEYAPDKEQLKAILDFNGFKG